ncbi:helix-turn-helix domain-containing protein [Cupriavidus plantarum]|uniref:helix-turn-helix domain-containing protein n=1 Tax=Cupriavidus plantarum TaxID=942865 RepID=UPI0015CBA8E1|nr:helix-turn-helix transcriptional regulator [Cupriavidus plantarum]NYI00227.1 transcriptional regulator with XRE-family HTH domain [Cupriavidus plantarum]
MSYRELIEKALHGRSVNQAAKDMAMQQVTLNRYVRGDRLPDYTTAFILAKEAGLDPRDVFMTLAQEEAKRKGLEIFSEGFKSLLSLVKPRRYWVPAW